QDWPRLKTLARGETLEQFKKFLEKENAEEGKLLRRAKRELKVHPVNMYIDLTNIPKEKNQLEQNIDTLALLISWHNKFGLNVRYILENDKDGHALEMLKRRVSEDLISCVGVPYVVGETIETREGEKIIVEKDEMIDIRLENINSIKKDRKINAREYIVALKDDSLKPEISIPNYTAAGAMGLSLAALRVYRDKLTNKSVKQKEYEQFRDDILKKFREIYERYKVRLVDGKSKFRAEELELMVTGSSKTKLYYTLWYSLPPAIKVIEGINKCHEIMQDILKFA
ncbi:MAG: hypothetical protein KJ983_02065, partial [Candidatus Omnitrophica bacterium]|nr:hypothetical protein [Candidatus Omnitrophota bacterium]